MSKYCPECGRKLPDEAKFCDACGTRISEFELKQSTEVKHAESVIIEKRPIEQSPEALRFMRFSKMAEAAEAAAERNAGEKWSYWDTPDNYSWSFKKLQKYSLKEDNRLEDLRENIVYFVSSGGAVGHLMMNIEDEEDTFEWIFYTENDNPGTLPSDQNMLEVGRSLLF